jgi:peptidoglycan/LPS O-acetylase OafA/YrhL
VTDPSITSREGPAAASGDATEGPIDPPEARSTTAFRPDLEGLRGVAILLVLLFHAGLPWVAGGFVGVDVFFVLSGFLITGLLVREYEAHGRVDLRSFYARRARRILPAAAVVILVTLAAAAVVLSPLDLLRVSGDATASALSVANIRFAADATDYFAPAGQPSPFLHYWSLGVEEQFYLVWPALLLVAVRFGRPRLGIGLALLTVFVASLAAAVLLTDMAQAWAFYSLPTRAWQLALGGLLALGTIRIGSFGRLGGIALGIIGWAGLGAIVAAAVLIDPAAAYPGTVALLPCLGAAAVILGAGHRFSARLLLERFPLRFLGRISYSLYLVHWPILVLPAAGLAIGDELPLGVRVGLALVAIPVAWVCYRLVELPIHRGRWFAIRPGRTLAVAGAAIAVTVVAGGAVMGYATRTLDSYTSAVATADTEASPPAGSPPPEPSAGSTPAPSAINPATFPAASAGPTLTLAASPTLTLAASAASSASPAQLGDPTPNPTTTSAATSPIPLSSTPAATASPQPTKPPPPTIPPQPLGAQRLPANVMPPLGTARNDTELLVRNGCNLQHVQVTPRDCVFGDPNGTITVALVGDSHTSQWFPAIERIATERGWRLVTFTKYDCRFMDMRMYSSFLKREYTECAAWREVVIQRLADMRPQLVIVGVSRFPAVINAADNDPERQGELLAQTIARVPGKVAILVDTPRFPFDVPGCISAHMADVRACEVSRATAFLTRHRIVERTAARISGATLIDLSDAVCPWDSCPVVLNGMIVYRDNHHLTATFALAMADAFAGTLPDLVPPTP